MFRRCCTRPEADAARAPAVEVVHEAGVTVRCATMSCERCEVATGVRTHRESECSGVVRVHRQHRGLLDSSRPGMGWEADPCVDALVALSGHANCPFG
ncbi:hypothetical protein DD237_008317 [Peronospora effusa]|uniref:Uncharacterized protein n=1 Tax=Peronospora effusa TaxID=542832 RepID=A0A3R7WD82_9STRA|nr:hypothetical protein DD237_008317 [Peronospora effusa]